MALLEMGADHTTMTEGPRTGTTGSKRAFGIVALVIGTSSTLVWLDWRMMHLGLNPLSAVVFLLELAGLASGVAISVGLVDAAGPRNVFEADRRESHRFAFAVADIVGRTRSADLHNEVRAAVRAARHRRPRRTADVAIAGVLLDAPRRLGLVAAVTLALLIGVSPSPMPPGWALLAIVIGTAGISTSHVLLGDGRIRYGDRIRWSYAALGEVLSRADREDLAPRRWVGTVATVVVMNVAIALRGMSDRWTHGLPPMDGDDRVVVMMLAVVIMLGAVYTLRTIAVPQLADSHLVSRRLEERTARQSALGAALCVGLVGLLAGILPGSADPADLDPVRGERTPVHVVGPVEPGSPADG
jgi:hypothetical protein